MHYRQLLLLKVNCKRRVCLEELLCTLFRLLFKFILINNFFKVVYENCLIINIYILIIFLSLIIDIIACTHVNIRM